MKIASIPVNTLANFDSLKSEGVEAVYICAAKGQKIDSTFTENYNNARAAGLKIGLYHHYEASKLDKMVNASAKEGRAFGAIIKGLKYDLPLCLSIVGKCMEAIPLRNGINAWAQYVDKITGKPPIRNTDKLIIRGTKDQLEVVDEDTDNSRYKRWIIGYEPYPKAIIEQVDITADDVTIHKGM